MKIINFVSTYEHYDNEELGIKPYTIRKYIDIPEWKRKKIDESTHLTIQRGYTKRKMFRRITHKLRWDVWIILAWNPNEIIKEH